MKFQKIMLASSYSYAWTFLIPLLGFVSYAGGQNTLKCYNCVDTLESPIPDYAGCFSYPIDEKYLKTSLWGASSSSGTTAQKLIEDGVRQVQSNVAVMAKLIREKMNASTALPPEDPSKITEYCVAIHGQVSSSALTVIARFKVIIRDHKAWHEQTACLAKDAFPELFDSNATTAMQPITNAAICFCDYQGCNDIDMKTVDKKHHTLYYHWSGGVSVTMMTRKRTLSWFLVLLTFAMALW